MSLALDDFCRAAATLGQEFGGSVTSWGRTVAHNKSVGGVDGSPHTWWLAVDLTWDAPPDRAAVDARAAALGLHVIWEGDHAHVQPAGWQNAPLPTRIMA